MKLIVQKIRNTDIFIKYALDHQNILMVGYDVEMRMVRAIGFLNAKHALSDKPKSSALIVCKSDKVEI